MVPTSTGISIVAWVHKNGFCQCLSPRGALKLVPVSLADTLRLVSALPSPMIHVLLISLVCLHWFFRSSESACKSFKSRFPHSMQSCLFFLDCSPLVFKARCLGACLSYAGSRGWNAWCGAWIPHSSGKRYCLDTVLLSFVVEAVFIQFSCPFPREFFHIQL